MAYLKGERYKLETLMKKYERVFTLFRGLNMPVDGVRMKAKWLYLRATAPNEKAQDDVLVKVLDMLPQIDKDYPNEIICQVIVKGR